MAFHVDSEVGVLKQVIVHRPGLELMRLTPDNVDDLLFDDVMCTPAKEAALRASLAGWSSSRRIPSTTLLTASRE